MPGNKNFLFLSPHHPPRIYMFAERLKRHGFNVLGMADADWNSLNVDLKRHISDYRKVDLNCFDETKSVGGGSYGNLKRTVADLVSKHGQIASIESFNEWWLPLEAQLRADFGVPGVNPEGLQNLIRKSRMKERFVKAGASVAKGEMLSTLERALEFQKEVGGVVVVKPDIGVGSSDTHKVATPEAMKAFFQKRSPKKDYFIERYISAPDRQLLSFDGLADMQGWPIVYAVHMYNEGNLEVAMAPKESYTYSIRDSEIPDKLRSIGIATVKAFSPEINGRFFHIEFFRIGDEYFGMEMNARPPGYVHLDMINHNRGVDIWDIYASMLAGEKYEFRPQRDGLCIQVGRFNSVKYKHTLNDIWQTYNRKIRMELVTNSNLIGDHSFVISPDDNAERETMLRYIFE